MAKFQSSPIKICPTSTLAYLFFPSPLKTLNLVQQQARWTGGTTFLVGNFSINLSLRQTDILSFSHRVHGLWFSNILKERRGVGGLKEGSIVILWLFTICIYCTRHILRFIVNMKNKQLNVKNIWHYYPATQMCCFQYAFHMLNIVYYMYISVSKRVQSRWKSTSLLSAMSFKGPNPQGQTNMRSNKVPEIPRTEKTFSVTLFQTSQAFLR